MFLCFALVPKLVQRTVDFHWYRYRIQKCWYRDNPSVLAETSSSSTRLTTRTPPCQGEPGLRYSSGPLEKNIKGWNAACRKVNLCKWMPQTGGD